MPSVLLAFQPQLHNEEGASNTTCARMQLEAFQSAPIQECQSAFEAELEYLATPLQMPHTHLAINQWHLRSNPFHASDQSAMGNVSLGRRAPWISREVPTKRTSLVLSVRTVSETDTNQVGTTTVASLLNLGFSKAERSLLWAFKLPRCFFHLFLSILDSLVSE